jgi:3D-(3,5/4)-trihydroxycyclohexane-1,2-dione acylhydrolase (decyclizing)
MVADISEGIDALEKELDSYVTSYSGEIEKAKRGWDKEMERLTTLMYGGGKFEPENKVRMYDALDAFVKATGGVICQTTALG